MMAMEVTAVMKPSRRELSEDIINILSYSVIDYHPFVLRTVQSKDECCTIDNAPRKHLYARLDSSFFLRPCDKESRS